MKLSDLKPCPLCRGPLVKPPIINWYVIRISTALLDPRHARETMGLAMMTGSLAIAEVMGPAADKAVAIIAEQPGATWTELHVCFDCYTSKLGALAGAAEQTDHDAAERDATLLNPCDFADGDEILDPSTSTEYRVVVADKRGMAKLLNLATGRVEEWNACNNRRFVRRAGGAA